MADNFIKPDYLNMLKDIFSSYCPKAEIWAYGSRINGDFHDGSDLDLAVKNFNEEGKSVAELKTLLNESDIPFLVDINEYENLPESFKSEIHKNYKVIFHG